MASRGQMIGGARTLQNNEVAFAKERAEILRRALHIRKYVETMGSY